MQLPSAVKRLEKTVKELRREKQEMETAHLKEIRSLMSELEQRDQRYVNIMCYYQHQYNSILTAPGNGCRVVQLSSCNSTLEQQLDTARQAVGNLKEEVCKLIAMKKEAEEEVKR